MPYEAHPSPELREAFQGYQGANPRDAKFVFIGLDANFNEAISDNQVIFQQVLKYLRDGPDSGKGRRTTAVITRFC